MNVPSRTFDACYYARSCGRPYKRDAEWLSFFGGIAERIAADIRPRRVLDAGCALGLLVETLRDRGVEAYGIDISAFAIEQVHEPVKPFCRQHSVSEPFSERYDLIVSIEVLEHMPAPEAEVAIANFCAHTDDILFSSSPFDFREATHGNVRPPEYWAAHFARHGFYRDVDFDASFITTWAVRFRKRPEPMYRVVADYERVFSQVVIERNELRQKALETQTEISQITQQREEAETREAATRTELETKVASAEAALGALARAQHEARTALEHSADELTQARADVLQAQTDLAAAREAEAQRQAELRDAQAAQATLQTELAEVHAADAHLQNDLVRAQDTVANMQRSLFWRARKPWAWLSRQIGRVSLVVLVAMSAGWSCRQPPPIPDVNNELPFGVVDGPPNGKVVGREVEVSGWALDDTGVAEVRIYVDARYKMSALLRIKRPDVTKVYPKYPVPEDMHGWWEVVDLGETAGTHNILVQAIDTSGATRDIGSVNVEVIAR